MKTAIFLKSYLRKFVCFRFDLEVHFVLFGLSEGPSFFENWYTCGSIKEFELGNRVSFLTRVNAMGQWPYCSSRMEVSYCTCGFGAIIQRDLLPTFIVTARFTAG